MRHADIERVLADDPVTVDERRPAGQRRGLEPQHLHGRVSVAFWGSLTRVAGHDTHQVRAGRGQGAYGPGLCDGSESTNGQRHPKDAEIVVVYLIQQPGVAVLVEPLELIEANRIPIRH